MIVKAILARLFPDRFIPILLATIALASLLPARGAGLALVSHIANAAIFSLFFFHGLRLERQSVWDGLKHWRLQGAVLATGYALIPLLGLLLSLLLPGVIAPELWLGILFLCALPSTVQAAIASASMAGGNIAASVVAAALSNLAGVLLTPLVFAALAHVGGVTTDLSAIARIATLLLLPFVLGQAARGWLGAWAERNKVWIGRLDRTTILITVYTAFSAAVVQGLWHRLDARTLVALFAVVLMLLALAFGSSWLIGRLLGLNRADRITLFYSGAHKSLATGAPMARILFPAATAGLIVIPLMLYHQLQLMISAWLATRWLDNRD